MAIGTVLRGLLGAAVLVPGIACALAPTPTEAGPLMRRIEERRACQEFASKLQAASGNPAMAQQVYQQGVLKLVAKFGENPCGDIPAPAPAPAPVATPAAPSTPSAPASTGSSKPPSAQQQQACQEFASKIQSAAASGGTAAAQQTYSLGTQKLTGMFGPNPCPAVKPPQ
ncbi:hypothetical protein NZK27_08700 [Synechococcus sp. FGCU-3]|nr:hypothetical protein [Synechococcus sp. FGCU3]